VQGIAENGKLYWLRTPRFGGWIYGPYVSHNHYAGLMEMLFPIALVLALTRHLRRDVKYLPVLAAVLMASTIFLCGSRGGMIAFVVQLATLGFIMKARKNRATLTAPVVLVGIAALVLWAGGAGFMTRVASIHSEARNELDTGLRLRIYRDGLRMFTYKPVLGWGLGTFPTVYPQFRSFYTNKFVNHAHNDYVQLLVETGLSEQL
jgi:O-antigen ligase